MDILLRWTDELARNLRGALRSIRQNPGFTAVALLSLALGIGANTAIFALLKRLLLSPLPVRDPGRLYQLVLETVRTPYYRMSYPKFEKVRDNFPIFNGLFGWGTSGERDLAEADRHESVHVSLVTGAYFDTLEVRPAIGRLITAGDDRAGGEANVIVLSYRLWKSMFAGDPGVLTRTVKIDQLTCRVIGVAPPEFLGAEPANPPDVYIPLHAMQPLAPQMIQNEGAMWMHFMGRLKPDVPLATAQAQLREGWPRLGQARQTMLGDNSRPEYMTLEDGSHGYSDVRIEFSRAVIALMALVTVVFLIACANLATLLFVRGARRAGEMAIRMALGAGRAQLIRQWLTECLVLALAGGLAGLLAARWLTGLLLYFVPEANRPYLRFHADAPLLLFTLLLTLAAGLLFGLLPAIRASRLNPEAVLRTHSRSVLGRRSRLARLILAGQLAASLLLVVGAVSFARTLWNLNTTPGGFDRNAVYALPAFGKVQYPRDHVSGAMKEILDRLNRSPHFASVSMGTAPILFGGSGGWGWAVVPGYTLAPYEDNVAYFSSVAPGYFHTLSIPLLAGRDFDERDRLRSPAAVIIVNEKFARHYFKGRSPLGQKVAFGPRSPLEIVGVVGDTHNSSLREPSKDLVYTPLPAAGWSTLVARPKAGVEPSVCESEMRSSVAAVAKGVPVETGRLEDAVQQSLRRDRLMAELSAAFGLLGVILASIGLYGAMAHLVSGRTREIGVHMALGANPWRVMRMIFRESLSVTALGMLAGLPLAIAGARLIQSLLFGVSPADPLTFAISAMLLAGAGLLAGLWPARRAARLPPTEALRYE